MRVPTSTYRLQVHGGFTLRDAEAVVGYLRRLGVGDAYLSPILASTEGSTHGYDVVAHDRVDDEAGGREALDELAETLRANGLGLVLDIVPNHVSVAAPEDRNAWWWDVLKYGQDSRWAKAFDVEWSLHDGRVVLPVLGAPLAECLDEITRDGDVLRYHDHVWPIAPGTGDGSVADVIARQHYLPELWRNGPNYRRFFDVTTLAGLRVEEDEVFEETHRLVLDLVRDGVVTGLRIDHPDGLADPGAYLERLPRDTWVVVEKILQPGETLPDEWPVAGTTGYDALNEVTALFVDPSAEETLTRVHDDFTGSGASWESVVEASKRQVLHEVLAPEVAWLRRLAPGEDVVERLVAMDVYRTYGHGTDPSPAFVTRFQQTSGAVMAKGVEDTAFYRWTRLVALNEVGGSPGLFGTTVEAFHERAAGHRGMTTLATHDTKRGEDVRARIALLSQVPEEWGAAVRRWSALNERHGRIERNLEYLMYQTFVGAYPLDAERAVAYALKAAREQKQRTSWLDPDADYEATVEGWVRGVLGDEEFTRDLDAFCAPLVVHGWTASLAQKLVQLTMPGVPDVYQGTELWDLSLVDPDNRRPVDFSLRRRLLDDLDGLTVEEIGERAAEGLPKLLLVSRALRLRRERPDVFAGSYEPLDVRGGWSDRVVAFARSGRVATVVPRLSLPVDDWKDTLLRLPEGRWHDVLTGDWVDGGERAVAEVLARFPVALLERA
jgi:(1->4)-alpha-D-glucan 1-alpha-D-glucosylmutase